jgi:DNA modification methylase
MTASQSLFPYAAEPAGAVECLGITFPSDEARRTHFLAILRLKLEDPDFRKIDGFPAGTDEDILALSDPPYYTACPNPFIEDFIKHYGRPYEPSIPYDVEPFAADVSEGKSDPIYNAHSYHTKVPHKAIMRYILHYTKPGDVVLDGFCGTGMTGVAAQLCADVSVIESLGYRVDSDGIVYAEERDKGVTSWKRFSKVGARNPILNDLSPAATFITYNYNRPLNARFFEEEAEKILHEVEYKYNWMYTTRHFDGKSQGRINYMLWSDVFTCPECAGDIVFWDVAVDKEVGIVRDEFQCSHCSKNLNKRNLERSWSTTYDSAIGTNTRQAKQVPVLISYSVGSKRFEKVPDAEDIALLEKITALSVENWFPTGHLQDGFNTRQPRESHGASHIHHFYTKRNLTILAALRSFGTKLWAPFSALTPRATRMHRIAASRIAGEKKGVGGATVGIINGTLYIPSLSVEMNVLDQALERIKIFKKSLYKPHPALTTTQSTTEMSGIPTNSIDYIFIDPPFGGNLMYSEINALWEGWVKVVTHAEKEAIENGVQMKDLDGYRSLMTACFRELFRVLKPGHWMTIEFSNTRAAVWNAIQTALQEAGFVVANVSALDKQQGSFKAVTTTTAVKQDLIISAYKPNGGLEDRFVKAGGSVDSTWDFVLTHLKYLPTVKVIGDQVDFIAERDPRIIFDRLVAWFVRHNFPVPLSSQEFQAGLSQRFVERDGMIFLPEQVSGYDKKRLQSAHAPQLEMFIADERSAIDWLSDFLRRRPSTYQEIHPEFIKQLGAGWKKHEIKPELLQLLEANFLCYDSKSRESSEVPSQIHSYLSTNYPEFRNLEKSDQHLKDKATNRWYVPDPNKARDLEMIREKALLKEFEIYRVFSGRRLKTFRLEAMRTGFKNAWANKDYITIIAVAQKMPEEALQEDEKLLLWYDQALTRTGVGA